MSNLIHDKKIVTWDIETTPLKIEGYMFNIWNQNIPPSFIKEPSTIICAAWRELGKKKVEIASIGDDPQAYKDNPHNDRLVVEALYEMIMDADMLVGHNSRGFDLKSLQARGLAHGLGPLPEVPHVDTYLAAKKYFRLASNKLSYAAQMYLDNAGKDKMVREDWDQIVYNSSDKHLRKMERYNKQDVRISEELYEVFRPYIRDHPNLNMITDYVGHACPNCGSDEVQKRGHHITRAGRYQRYQCQSCGAWSHDGKQAKTGKVTLR